MRRVLGWMGKRDAMTDPDPKWLVLAALIQVRDAERERCAGIAQDRHKQWHADMDNCEVCDDESACADIAAAIRRGE